MSDRKIEALLTLCGNGRGPIGRDRIAMLEGVAIPSFDTARFFTMALFIQSCGITSTSERC